MKVLHVIPSISPVHGGPSAAMQLIAESLKAEGVAITIATTDDDGPGRRLPGSAGGFGDKQSVPICRFAKQSEFYKFSWPLFRWLAGHVREYDLVHVHALFSFPSVVGAWTARSQKMPYIIRPIGVLERYGMATRRPVLKSLSLTFIEKHLLRDAAAVQFTSESECEQAKDLGIAMNSVVVPLGVDACEIGNGHALLERYPLARDQKRILFLSRIDPKKNIEGLVRALAMVHLRGSKPVLFLAGTGPVGYVESLKVLAMKEGIADSIFWLGHVSGSEKADALALADLFVLPSFSENFGIAAAEALAAGVPCVLGRGVAIASAVETAGAGVAIDPAPESIAQAIAALLCDDDRRYAAGLAASRLAVERYSTRRMGADLLTLYTQVLAGRGTRHA